MAKTLTERPVIICTKYRGVFFGYATDTKGETIDLKRARMAIYWGTSKGIFQLAETGPTSSNKISARADLNLREITCVIEVSEVATKAWEGVV